MLQLAITRPLDNRYTDIQAIQGDMAQVDGSGPDFLSAVRFFGDPGPYRGPDRSKAVRSPSLLKIVFVLTINTSQLIALYNKSFKNAATAVDYL